MRKIITFFATSIFLGILANYVLHEFTPIDLAKLEELVISNEIQPGEWERLNLLIGDVISKGLIFQYLSSSAYLGFFLILGSIFCLFVSLHLIADKIFFKNYYETPSIYNAVRRGTLLVLALGIIVYMKLSLVNDLTILLVPIVAIIFEVLFLTQLSPFLKEKMKTEKDLKTL